MKTSEDLRELLERIDHRGYPAYKDIRGRYQFRGYVLSVDHVQGDPFASPSKVSVEVPGKISGFPQSLYETPGRRIGLQDELLRQFGRQAERAAFKAKGSGKSGLISVSRPGQEILERSACEKMCIRDRPGDNGKGLRGKIRRLFARNGLAEYGRRSSYYPKGL